MTQVITLPLKGVNAYLVIGSRGTLLVDCGFPASLPAIGRQLRPFGLTVHNISLVMVTHFHIDHAGCVQDLVNAGASLLLIRQQQPYISVMETMARNKWSHTPISASNYPGCDAEDASATLTELGIPGKILLTPGHTPGCISLLLHNGTVITGDLPLPHHVSGNEQAIASWQLIRQQGGHTVLPGHGAAFNI